MLKSLLNSVKILQSVSGLIRSGIMYTALFVFLFYVNYFSLFFGFCVE